MRDTIQSIRAKSFLKKHYSPCQPKPSQAHLQPVTIRQCHRKEWLPCSCAIQLAPYWCMSPKSYTGTVGGRLQRKSCSQPRCCECHCPGASWMVGQGCFLNTGIQVTILNYAATLSSYLKSQSSQAKSPVTGENGVSHLFLKKGDEDCRSYPPVSLTTVHGKIMVYRSSQKTHQNIWKMERWLRTANMSCSFSKGKQYQTNRVALDDGVTALVDKGWAIAVIYLDFWKVFKSPSQHSGC